MKYETIIKKLVQQFKKDNAYNPDLTFSSRQEWDEQVESFALDLYDELTEVYEQFIDDLHTSKAMPDALHRLDALYQRVDTPATPGVAIEPLEDLEDDDGYRLTDEEFAF